MRYLFILLLACCSLYSYCQCEVFIGGDSSPMCPGDASRDLLAFGASPGSTTKWTKDGNQIYQGTNGAITITEPGVYTVQVTTSSGCVSNIASFTIPSGTNCGATGGGGAGACSLSISSSSGNTINSSQSTTLTLSGCSGSVSWSTGQSGNSISVSPSSTTNYTATCGSCSSNGSTSITINVESGGGGGTTSTTSLGPYVGINMTNNGQILASISSFNLAVKGKILAEEIRVRTGWADYVFAPGYYLRPLSKVEHFINTHHHLPDVPSAAQVEKQGIALGTSNAMLLRKIEELTLYIIQQEKRIKSLEKRIVSSPRR